MQLWSPEHFAPKLTDHLRKRTVEGEVPGRLHGEITAFDNSAEKTTMFTLEFFNCDIINCQPDKADATTEAVVEYPIPPAA